MTHVCKMPIVDVPFAGSYWPVLPKHAFPTPADCAIGDPVCAVIDWVQSEEPAMQDCRIMIRTEDGYKLEKFEKLEEGTLARVAGYTLGLHELIPSGQTLFSSIVGQMSSSRDDYGLNSFFQIIIGARTAMIISRDMDNFTDKIHEDGDLDGHFPSSSAVMLRDDALNAHEQIGAFADMDAMLEIIKFYELGTSLNLCGIELQACEAAKFEGPNDEQ